jgi:hypothetical protein
MPDNLDALRHIEGFPIGEDEGGDWVIGSSEEGI